MKLWVITYFPKCACGFYSDFAKMTFQMNIDLMPFNPRQMYPEVLEIIPYFLIDSHDDSRDKNFTSD